MKLWIASDCSLGRELVVDTPDKIKPSEIARQYGRAESGELVQIWVDDKDQSIFPDYSVVWDSFKQKYVVHAE